MPQLPHSLHSALTVYRLSTGSYYDASGVMRWSQRNPNRVTHSRLIADGAWVNNNTTKSTIASPLAPDGSPTATKIVKPANSSSADVNQNITGLTAGIYTASLHVRPGAFKYVRVRLDNFTSGGSVDAFLDLNSGKMTVTTAGSGLTLLASGVDTQSYSDGWMRPYFTVNGANTSISIKVYLVDSANSIAVLGDAVKEVYLWGMELSPGSLAPHNEVTVLYEPRFDHDPVTLAPLGMLLESQRINFVAASEDMTNATYYSVVGATVTAAAALAPDGVIGMTLLKENTSTGLHYLQGATTVPTGTLAGRYMIYSVFVKPAGRTIFTLSLASIDSGSADFNLSTLTTSNLAGGSGGNAPTYAGIKHVGNGIYRCWFVMLWGAADTIATFYPQFLLHNGTSNTYTGDGASGVYLWGTMVEESEQYATVASPTSYIRTINARVTREQDEAVLEQPLHGTLGTTSTWVVEFTAPLVSAYRTLLSMNNGGGSIFLENANKGSVGVVFTGDGVTANTIVPGQLNKLAASRDGTGQSVCLNGGAVAAGTNSIGGNTVTITVMGRSYGGGYPLNGWISKITYYPTRLTSAQMQAATT